jgi:microcystin-dependent protein
VLCDGSSYDTTVQADLFAVIGYTYGGAGANFNVPDVRGRVMLGLDDMGGASANVVTNAAADAPGGTEGSETHTLVASEIPAHTHTISSSGAHTHSYTYRDNESGVGSGAGATAWKSTSSATTGSSGGHTHTINNSGGSGAHENMPPYMALAVIIKT